MKRFKDLPIIAAIIFGLTPIIWFWGRTGMLINGNDTNFPLNPVAWFLKRFYIWNDGLTGGVEASTAPAGLFFHALQVFFFWLTSSLQATELLTFIFWFTAIPLSFYLFLRLVFKKFNPLAAIVGMVLYTFNIYLFNTWENAKVANLALVVGLPALLGLFIFGLREGVSKKVLAAVAIVGFITAGSGINPAYFAVFILALSLYLLFTLLGDIARKERTSFLKHILSSFKFFAVLILANFFWILPLFRKLFLSGRGPVSDISQLGLVNWLRDLSQNTSVLNILRLQGAWDWYSFEGVRPLYIPYAPTYFSNHFFIAFSLLIPLLVLVSVLFVRKHRNLVLFFAFLFSLGVFFGVGAHGSLGSVYLWLSRNVPFFSFFRSPWYIFTPLTTISMSTLAFLLFNGLFALKTNRLKKQRLLKLGVGIGAVVLIGANLFYTYPLVTGDIFRPDKRDNTFMLAIPDYVFSTRDWLSGLKDEGRILSFPNTPIERFTWGYSGLDSILQLISSQDVIYPSFGATKKTAVDILQERIHKFLEKGNFKDAFSLASLFSAERLFVKNDAVVGREISFKPGYKYLETEPEIFGSWEFYTMKNEYILPRIYVPRNVIKVDGDLASVADARVTEEEYESAFFYAPQIGSNVFFEENVTDRVFQARNGELENFKAEIQLIESIKEENTRHRRKYFDRARFNPFKVIYTVKVAQEGEYELLIKDSHLEDYGLGFDNGWSAVLDGEKVVLNPRLRKDGWIYLEPLFLTSGQHHLEIFLPKNPNLVEDGSFEEGKWLGNKGVSLSLDARDGKYALELTATTEQAWVIKPINNFDPESVYLLSVEYKREFGPRPTIMIVQKVGEHTPRRQKELLSLSKEWVFYETLFQGEDIPSRAEIGIFADGNVEEGTRHLYDNLSLRRVFSSPAIFRRRFEPSDFALPTVTFEKINPTRYRVHVERAERPYFLVFSETFDKDWKLYTGVNGKSIFATLLAKPEGEEKHLIANGYANSWFVDKTGSYDLLIEYTPQRLFVFALGISSIVVLSSIGFLGSVFIKNRKERK